MRRVNLDHGRAQLSQLTTNHLSSDDSSQSDDFDALQGSGEGRVRREGAGRRGSEGAGVEDRHFIKCGSLDV